MLLHRRLELADDRAVPGELALAVLADGLAIGGDAVLVDLAGLDQLGDDGGNAAGAVIVLAQIFTGGLEVDDQRQVIAVLLPVGDGQFDAEMGRDGVQVVRRVGRPPMAVLTAMAFSKASRVMIFEGVRSSFTMSTMRRPVA